MNPAPLPASGPLISVVLPTFQAAPCIEGALESLAGQTWRGFEVVVSDGASTDGTLECVRAWSHALPSLTVSSRRDAGVYDAINQGVRLSRGTWFLVLGADDRLHASSALGEVAAVLQDAQALTGPAGGVEVLHGDVRMMASNQTGTPAGERYAGPMPLERLLRTNVCQQAIFYRRSLFEALGGFDLRYPLHADWQFNVRAALRQPFHWVDVIVADYAATGMSAGREDEAWRLDRLDLLRDTLRARPRDRALWPAHRQLLRDARAWRKRGRWADWADTLALYGRLRLLRWMGGRAAST